MAYPLILIKRNDMIHIKIGKFKFRLGRVKITKQALKDNGFSAYEDYWERDNIKVTEHLGHWTIKMLEDNQIIYNIKYVDELEDFFEACGVDFN